MTINVVVTPVRDRIYVWSELECFSLFSVVCCQVDVSVTGRSLVQRSPTKRGVSECDLENSMMRRPCITISIRTTTTTTTTTSSSSSSSSSSNSSLALFHQQIIRLQSTHFPFSNNYRVFNFHLWIGRIGRMKCKIIITKWLHTVTGWLHKARSVSISCHLVLCFTKSFSGY